MGSDVESKDTAKENKEPVTDYQGPVTDHQGPVTDYEGEVTDFTGVVTDYDGPVVDDEKRVRLPPHTTHSPLDCSLPAGSSPARQVRAARVPQLTYSCKSAAPASPDLACRPRSAPSYAATERAEKALDPD